MQYRAWTDEFLRNGDAEETRHYGFLTIDVVYAHEAEEVDNFFFCAPVEERHGHRHVVQIQIWEGDKNKQGLQLNSVTNYKNPTSMNHFLRSKKVEGLEQLPSTTSDQLWWKAQSLLCLGIVIPTHQIIQRRTGYPHDKHFMLAIRATDVEVVVKAHYVVSAWAEELAAILRSIERAKPRPLTFDCRNLSAQ
jgi:hypothetical protein